ncbi:gluconokinase [Rhodococcus aerolatus]
MVMGVSGSGKTTVAEALAERLGVVAAEADEFHPEANIEKMRAGHPLDDDDRAPWLAAIADWLAEQVDAGRAAVITCSALKRRYRDTLRGAGPEVVFLHLAGPEEVVAERMGGRRGHFMPTALLDSQYADLEPLGDDEGGLTADVTRPVADIVDDAVRALAPGRPAG